MVVARAARAARAPIGNIPPAEAEKRYYPVQENAAMDA